MERSYLDIKVTFVHVVILIIAIILIGIMLFFLGYKAGKSSVIVQPSAAETLVEKNNIEELNLTENQPEIITEKNETDAANTITEEIQLHQQPITTEIPKKDTAVQNAVSKETYYAVQVGAFSTYSNAQQYSKKFSNLGYPTEILTGSSNNRTLYRVRVGKYSTADEAKTAQEKLEKMEKKKFSVSKSN